MNRVLKFTLIGCGGLIALVVVLVVLSGIIAAFSGGNQTANEPKKQTQASKPQTQESQAEKKAERKKVAKELAKAKEQAKEAKEEAAQAKQEAKELRKALKEKAKPEHKPEKQSASSSDEDNVIVRVTGDPGLKFQGAIGNLDTTRTVEGTTPEEFTVKGVDTGFLSADIVTANAQKMQAGNETLTVEIVVDGKAVKKASTSASYGLAQTSWSAAE